VATVIAVVAGCGSGASSRDTAIRGTTLTIYSSLPLHGDAGASGQDVVLGEKLALAEAAGRVGAYTVKYVSLDDTNPKTGRWDPGVIAGNSRTAAQDRTTVAYLGELDPGSSAISIPVLNEINVLQVSPGDTFGGLTESEDSSRGEPEKYYPTGERTFGRIVPSDEVQAAVLIRWMRDEGVRRVFLLTDTELSGPSLARRVQSMASEHGLAVAGSLSLIPRPDADRKAVQKVLAAHPDAVLYAGLGNPATAALLDGVAGAAPQLKIFTSSGVAASDMAGKLHAAAPRTYVVSPALGLAAYPPAARRFARAFRSRYGRAPGPYAVLGYEAMRVVLHAMAGAGKRANHPEAVIRAFFGTRDRRSVLGTYSIDPNGDTTLRGFGGYRVRRGSLAFDRALFP
jgi:branched-chain amino acid transport system substrate-binding protein